jgi:GT2 family glycosyltransferase
MNREKRMVDLSIIIVNYNTRDFLRSLLSSLRKNANRSFSSEIFVVDNASVDGSGGMVAEEYPEVTLICSDVNLGFAKANNRAIREATGNVILLLNPDTLLLPDHEFSLILEYFQSNPTVGIVGGRVFDGGLRQVSSYGRFPTPGPLLLHFSFFGKILARLIPPFRKFRLADYNPASYNIEKPVDHVNGCCLFIRAEMIGNIGSLDEIYFMYLEETDLCKRARDHGWKVMYVPARTVIHYGQESSKQHRSEMSEQFLKSMRLFYQKHYPGSIKHLDILMKLKIIKPRIKRS